MRLSSLSSWNLRWRFPASDLSGAPRVSLGAELAHASQQSHLLKNDDYRWCSMMGALLWWCV